MEATTFEATVAELDAIYGLLRLLRASPTRLPRRAAVLCGTVSLGPLPIAQGIPPEGAPQGVLKVEGLKPPFNEGSRS